MRRAKRNHRTTFHKRAYLSTLQLDDLCYIKEKGESIVGLPSHFPCHSGSFLGEKPHLGLIAEEAVASQGATAAATIAPLSQRFQATHTDQFLDSLSKEQGAGLQLLGQIVLAADATPSHQGQQFL